MTPEPHFFLLEDNLEQIETWRVMVANARRSIEHTVEHLRGKLDGLDATLLESVLTDHDVAHTFLVAALDARTAQITNEALGYEPPE